MSMADERLRRILGGDHLAALRKRLRRRFELAPVDGGVESFRLGSLSTEEHAALSSLLGRPPRSSNSLTIDVGLVDAAFRNAGVAASLRDALEQLDGPIAHLASDRLRADRVWSDVVEGCDHPALSGLLRVPFGLGLLRWLSKRDAATAAELCRRADAVLRRLPAHGITRSQLAADVLGDAHALDGGQPTATLVLAALRRNAHDPEPADDDGSPRWDRDTWARAGVLVNELARPVLSLNLPTRESGNGGHPPGEPVYASLRSLLRSPPSWDVAHRKVFVCENPNLLAIAADHWGAACAPLVCTDGMPAAAQRCLLSQLAKAQALLCYHGDFDWPGLRIGNHVMREYGARPWRFGAADYETAVHAIASRGAPLSENSVIALWDEALTAMMQRYGISIAEEAHAAALLPDLQSS